MTQTRRQRKETLSHYPDSYRITTTTTHTLSIGGDAFVLAPHLAHQFVYDAYAVNGRRLFHTAPEVSATIPR